MRRRIQTGGARTLLGGRAPAEFLARYWQKRPLLVRGAFPHWRAPLSPEDLAGLACEPEAQARLIFNRGPFSKWRVRQGPFQPRDFARLPRSQWTLLVQAVDAWVPEVADMLDRFSFVPAWRLDDVMVSYAVRGGGVGPHVDRYDVFLIQGQGRRRWRIGRAPVERETWIPGLPLRVLEDFRPAVEWVLNPGDMLYLPPGVPHDGVALDAGLTFSVGFRAPSGRELWEAYLTDAYLQDWSEIRYADPDLTAPREPGEISAAALRRALGIFRSLPQTEQDFVHWFGRYATTPRRGFLPQFMEEPLSVREFAARLAESKGLRRCAGCRMAYVKTPSGSARLYINGQGQTLPLRWAALLSRRRTIPLDELRPALKGKNVVRILAAWVNQGLFVLEE